MTPRRTRPSVLWTGWALAVLASASQAQILEGPKDSPEEEARPVEAAAEAQEESDAQALHAVRAAKILTAARKGPQVIRDGVIVMKGKKILAVGPADEVEVPEGVEVFDAGERWILPGFVELHCHVGTTAQQVFADINSAIYLTNPGLRVNTSVVPRHGLLQRAVAGGVTTVLYIPGSATSMGGEGVLLKIGNETYEEMEVRSPGSLKVAQAGNPESWGPGFGRSFLYWNLRNTFLKGQAYAKRWEAFERGEGDKPDVDPQFEVFRPLFARETQVSTHTQFYQVVLTTITMLRVQFGLDVYIDHGTFGGFKAAELAEETGVPAIIGPRSIAMPIDFPLYEQLDTDGRVLGICAEYQARGHTMIGFNTDCIDGGGFAPAQEELSLQAAMALRYGMTNFDLESVRGLTIIPAMAAGLGDRIGSLETGKDADLILVEGDPADPRTKVTRVYTDGRLIYDIDRDGQLW